MVEEMNADQKATWERAFGALPKKKVNPYTSEKYVHNKVTQYLKTYRPSVRFLSNLAGESFGKGQAMNVRDQQSHNGAPDIMIFARMGGRSGLALELKREGLKIFKKDGTLIKDDHLAEQAEYLRYLRADGWVAEFACGVEEAKRIINLYFNQNDITKI